MSGSVLAVGAAPDLSERQALIFAAIETAETMPSVRQLCAITGVRWPTVVHRELVRLQMKGLLPAGEAAVRRLATATERAERRQPKRVPRPRQLRTERLPGSTTHVDEVAVWRALRGEPARPLGIAERVEAVRVAARRGWSDGRIAECLGIWPRSVLRIREQHGIPAGVPCTRRVA